MLSTAQIQERRERVFLVLAGIFICAMTLLNILGITRFIQLGPLSLAIGVTLAHLQPAQARFCLMLQVATKR